MDAARADAADPGLRLRARVEGARRPTVLQRFFGTDRIAFETCSLTLPPGSTCTDPSPVTRSYCQLLRSGRRRTGSRASSSASTSARRSTKGSSTGARSATSRSTASSAPCAEHSSWGQARPRSPGASLMCSPRVEPGNVHGDGRTWPRLDTDGRTPWLAHRSGRAGHLTRQRQRSRDLLSALRRRENTVPYGIARRLTPEHARRRAAPAQMPPPPPPAPGSRRPSSKVECAWRSARDSARRSSRSRRAVERCCRRSRHLASMTHRQSASFDISAPLLASCHGDPRVRDAMASSGGAVGTPVSIQILIRDAFGRPRRLGGWICTGTCPAGCRRCCRDPDSESPKHPRERDKAPRRGAFPCVEEDSNLHPV